MPDLQAEQRLFSSGLNNIGGIDEAGRGPLAGPVVAACVVINREFKITDNDLKKIKDSKLLSAKKREELFALIKSWPVEIGVGICDHLTIDRINILQASFLAMKKALGMLKQKPDYILLDGKFPIPNISIPQQAIVNGDKLIFSIAAASIIAKVTRDQIMKSAQEKFPEYGFAQHKGYGTKKHLAALKEFGPCLIHRQSFKPVKLAVRRAKH
jgi:ribonuclease HII